MGQYDNETVAQWHNGVTEQRDNETTGPWTMGQWDNGTMDRRTNGQDENCQHAGGAHGRVRNARIRYSLAG